MNAVLLPTTSAGPLAEIRRVLGEAQEFVAGLAADANDQVTTGYRLLVSEPKKAA